MSRIFAAFLIVVPVWVAQSGELTFTFIGNEAFHISDGQATLVSDYPYTSGVFGYMAYEKSDVPPIKNGVSLITHKHGDHWNPKLFREMDTLFVGPPVLAAKLPTDRVVPFELERPMEVNGITIKAIVMEHAQTHQHFSYLVTWHGLRLYFVGDTESPADLLLRKDIDVMFITPWLIRTISRQNLKVDAKELVVYHQKDGEQWPKFQNHRRMKQGQSFRVGFEK